MKKLVLIIAVNLISLNTFSQTTKTYKKGEVVSSWSYPPPNVPWDSVKNVKEQINAVNELNLIRKKAGKPLLKWDTRLQPAAVHHVNYMRYCKKHHLVNTLTFVHKDTSYDAGYMGHDEIFDVPNFTEIEWPSWRISLLDRNVFSEMTEELGTVGTVMGFNWCEYHWAALNNAKWDSVYAYTDPYTRVTIVILSKYKKIKNKE